MPVRDNKVTLTCPVTGQDLRYFCATDEFDPDAPNPFSADGAFGQTWTAFLVADEGSPVDFMGCNKARTLFLYRCGLSLPGVPARLADFLRHENQQGRDVILSAPEDVDLDTLVSTAVANTPAPHIARDTDPAVVVHSTSEECARQITADGCLKSLACLEAERKMTGPRLGFHGLNEPPEYADFIHFGGIDSPSPEAVIGSNQKGRFVRLDEPYRPGCRYYLDWHRIVRQGLDVRSGGTPFCVRRRLPLDGFLLATVTLDDVPQAARTWTPASYVPEANRRFRVKMSPPVGRATKDVMSTEEDPG